MYATPRATLDFFTYAQRICAINSSKDKNSCRSFAKLSAWCVPSARFLFFCCIAIYVMYATPRATLDFFTYAQRICAIGSSKDKKLLSQFRQIICLMRAFGTLFVLSLLNILQLNAHCKSRKGRVVSCVCGFAKIRVVFWVNSGIIST